jgi:glutamine amidotransferase-like uncharacterized protein
MFKKLILSFSFALAIVSAVPSFASPPPKDLALVWDGPGAEKPFPTQSAAEVANKAGYRVIYIHPGFSDYSLFNQAAVWIQPGGKSTNSSDSMGPELLDHIRQFVKQGGAFVGFCAGMFLATNEIGTSGAPGLGILPGNTKLFLENDPGPMILTITLPNEKRSIYYSGGPYLTLTPEDQKAYDVQVLSTYSNGAIASTLSRYGKGKVAVSGFHPEASNMWKLIRGKWDSDGSDQDIAVEMIQAAVQI